MSKILKSGTDEIAKVVKPLDWRARMNVSTDGDNKNPNKDTLGVQQEHQLFPIELIRQLEKENENLVLALESIKAEAQTAEEIAYNRGVTAGETNAVQDDKKRFSLLSGMADAALENYSESMSSIEGLAILLARSALRKILGEQSRLGSLLEQTIRHQVRELGDSSELTVQVSKTDFPDENAMQSLMSALENSQAKFEYSVALRSGECHIKTRLGGVDIGIPGQLEKLDTLLSEMAGFAR